MNHPTDDLVALLDGALPAPRAAELERHLEGCPGCRAERERLAGALAALRRLPAPPAPSPHFTVRLAARLARERRPGLLARLSSWRWRVAVPAAAAAAAAAVLLVGQRREAALDRALAADLELVEELELVASLGDVESAEDAAVVAALDGLDAGEGRP